MSLLRTIMTLALVPKTCRLTKGSSRWIPPSNALSPLHLSWRQTLRPRKPSLNQCSQLQWLFNPCHSCSSIQTHHRPSQSYPSRRSAVLSLLQARHMGALKLRYSVQTSIHPYSLIVCLGTSWRVRRKGGATTRWYASCRPGYALGLWRCGLTGLRRTRMGRLLVCSHIRTSRTEHCKPAPLSDDRS